MAREVAHTSEDNGSHQYSVDERVYARQRALTEKTLFDYYMISSCCEDEVYTPFPYYLDKSTYLAFVDAAQTIDGIVRRIISGFSNEGGNLELPLGNFPLLQEIRMLKSSVQPFFWVRFDAFQREGGGIFFSEFNYDKPCAQRETLISERFAPKNNPNEGFSRAFHENFSLICNHIPHCGRQLQCAILVLPDHEEEVHLAHLYMDMLHDLPVNFVIAGPENILVGDDGVVVFGSHVDIILRQFPVEKLHKIANAKKLLQLFDDGLVTIVNDPRAIVGQAKSLFAYLRRLAESGSTFLTHKERQTILNTLPYTILLEEANLNEVAAKRDKYVVKAVYSRYSEQVYIGKMMTDVQWTELLKKASASSESYILQEFCPIRRERVLCFDGEIYTEATAYGNFGIYLSNGKYCGLSTRWSSDYLSSDSNVFISPVGIKDRGVHFAHYLRGKAADAMWNSVNDEAAFSNGFTGGYTGNQRSFSLNPLIMDQRTFEELKNATEAVAHIFHKTAVFVKRNSELFFSLLGIPAGLKKLILKSPVEEIFLGRFDWVIDTAGNLKLLEFNAETPAGLTESAVLNGMIRNHFQEHFGNTLHLQDPNANLLTLVKQQFMNITAQYNKIKPIKTIGFVACSYEEDWYNTGTVLEALSDLPYEFVRGEITGLGVLRGGLTLCGKPVDSIYCYYPHDWLCSDSYFKGTIRALSKTYGIIPPFSIIEQSKALFALIWELRNTDFYTKAEASLIDQYLPFTSLQPDSFQDGDTCVKPYFGREGENVDFAYRISGGEEDMIFQQRIEIGRAPFDVVGHEHITESAYPVIGAFTLGTGKFGGIYTRVGARVTDKRAVYAPIFIKP